VVGFGAATLGSIGFALIGCGRIGLKYINFFRGGDTSEATLVAVCDPNTKRASEMVSGLEVPVIDDPIEMMKQFGHKIHVIAILAPSGLHARLTIDLAQFGKDIIVEKPMALTVADADLMIDACDSAGVRLFVVMQNRLNFPIQKLHKAIQSGRFGKLVMATARIRWCRKQEYYDEYPWRGSFLGNGGVFANQGSHYLDLLQWMCGDVTSVFAKTSKALLKIETEDTGIAILKFKSGTLGVIEATMATRPADLEGSISILGEYGSVEISGFALNEVRTWKFIDEEPQDAEIEEFIHSKADPQTTIGHNNYLRHLINCIRDHTPGLVDGREGRKSVGLISAIYKSSFSGREIILP
jgi:predicted dehydrogenase